MRYSIANRQNSYGLVDKLFEDFFNDSVSKNYSKCDVLKTDITDEGDHYSFKIEVPSLNKENLNIALEDGYLNVSATFEDSKEENKENNKYLRRERYYGSFSRSFYVGDEVKEEDIKAKLDNGVLNLMINKPQEQAAPEKKIISIE
ncbi:MAG: Hsp20/alpha crystallin family protein [Bacilli bacterium]|nr:Hsp20/alpha crystallin family protein [Bacilli bacterium]